MNEQKFLLNTLPLAACVLVVSACVTSTPEQVMEHHGDSVRNMIAEQTYEPGDVVPAYDGEKSQKVLKTYRGDVTDPKKVEKQVIRLRFK